MEKKEVKEIWISKGNLYEDDVILLEQPSKYWFEKFNFLRVVAYSDYESLLEENEALKEQLKKVQDLIR